MRRLFINLLMAAVLYPSVSLAGGIVTNTNQSASFIRKPVQDAVIDATGTYYNPAGLVFLEEGFHLSLSNQTISQTRTITSTLPLMSRKKFEGGVSAPLFPTVYAVYKTGNLAFSFGVNPIGGGGSATFDDGLPSFEQQVAVLPPTLTDLGLETTQYSMNAAFDGSSLNWGIQFNTSYAINEMIGVSAGVRYVIANNSYTGYLRNIMIDPIHPLNPAGPGNMTSAPVFFSTLSEAAPDEETTNLMAGLAHRTSDKELDATQAGSGFTPVVGLNIKFSDDFNVALKYEHKTSIIMTNATTIDDVGMYPDKAEVAADMPAMLAFGASYSVLPQLRISGGVHYYFDKSADYGKSLPNDEIIDNNFWEAAFGFEYALNRNLILSTGYLRTQTGVNDLYHSDLSHSLSTNSIGGGAKYMINSNLGINLGVMSTMYEAHTKSFTMSNINYDEIYDRVALTFAIGVDVKF